MKKILSFNMFLILVLVVGSCTQEFIDPITKLEPEEDESAPVVAINYPLEGTLLQTNEAITSINIDFEVTDDIEIANVSVELDGVEIVSYTEFLDYRRLVAEYLYEEVTTGSHTLTIIATDIEQKESVSVVNFEKGPPYVPVYNGETFYMSFDGDLVELNSLTNATIVGSPGFTSQGEGVLGSIAYQGASESYLTFPATELQGEEFSATFWMKVNDSNDRAGILVAAPEAEDNNDRTKGFRFFREASNGGATQRFKLNVGNGDADSWFDGGEAADVTPNTGEWTHFGFSISQTEVSVYINGQVVSQGGFAGMDWTDVDVVSIMSGEPFWTGWNHLADASVMDELRLYNEALSQEEIQTVMLKEQATLYLDFDGDFDDSVNEISADVSGSPGISFSNGIDGDAYEGATDSYLTFSTEDLNIQGTEFSASFWIDINISPDRAGILVMGPEDSDNADFPDVQNDRTSGFRFFREASNDGATQRFKLNVGNGAADSWFDGGAAADVDPASGWNHFAFSISESNATVYINGVSVSSGDFAGIDWTGCNVLSIMSGAPRFTQWNHLSDESLMDELILFNKALSQEEVIALYNDGY